MTQEELNARYASRQRQGKSRKNLKIAVPEYVKKIRMLERIAESYKMDNR